MIIEIKRFYIMHDMEAPIMINTRYIKRIEPLRENHPHFGIVKSVILYDNDMEGELIYTRDAYGTIKGKITRARKTQDE